MTACVMYLLVLLNCFDMHSIHIYIYTHKRNIFQENVDTFLYFLVNQTGPKKIIER